MKTEIPDEWVLVLQDALDEANESWVIQDVWRAALAAVIPLVQEEEREAIAELVENTPCPGEADETESGHRYASGYRDASQAARDELNRLMAAIRARGGA